MRGPCQNLLRKQSKVKRKKDIIICKKIISQKAMKISPSIIQTIINKYVTACERVTCIPAI